MSDTILNAYFLCQMRNRNETTLQKCTLFLERRDTKALLNTF
jgi:hypothetical protein